MKRIRFNKLAGAATGVALAAVILYPGHRLRASEPLAAAKPHASDGLFEPPGRIISIEFVIDEASMTSLRRKPKSYVRARVRAGEQNYSQVAIKIKGGARSLQSVEQKPSWTLNVDRYLGGQRFHGLDKVHLNNSVQDPSYLREWLSTQLFAGAGLPVARTAHAWLSLNGKNLGLYVLTEGYDKTFLKRWFGNSSGNLYEGENQTDVDQNPERDSGDGPQDGSDLKTLADAAAQASHEVRARELGLVLDIPLFLKYAALETITGHWNGYIFGRNNYRLYSNPATRRFQFLPGGLETTFQKPEEPISSETAGLVSRGVLTVPALRRDYLATVGALNARFFRDKTLLERYDLAAVALRERLLKVDPTLAASQSKSGAELRKLLAERLEYLPRSLPGRP